MHRSFAVRIAIPQWKGRIAPVFDVAGHLLLVDVEDGDETHREEKRLVRAELPARAAELLGYGTDVLICGAISAPLQFRIAAAGVRVIAFVCGAVDEVLAAYLNGRLASETFAMPGCRRWRRRGGEDVPPVGSGAGRRRARYGQGRKRTQDDLTREAPRSAAENEFFTCPQCSEKVSREWEPGQARSVCSRCGAPIARAAIAVIHSGSTRRRL